MLQRQWTANTLGAQAKPFPTHKELLSQERWQAILQCKQDFLENQADDPCRHPYMDQDVGASWIRSRNMGVDPYTVVTRPNLTAEKLSEILDEHRVLIDSTNCLARSFKDLIISCGYILYLFDKTGVVLLNEGNWGNFPLFSEHDSRMGIVADENSEGTTAHELCIRLKRPVQLLGPEHYCVAFQNRIASSAPIKDENDEVYAALVLLSQPLLNPPEEDTLKNMCLHSLGLITSMAVTIESQLKLKKTTEKLDAAVLKLNSYEKVTTQVNNRSGNMGSYTFEDIISKNKEFKKIIALTQRFASTPENILLIGESGTGKELFAQAIHNIHRPQGPFVAVNCAAMPRELIESELFGYEGGSFTGAERSGKPGKIELAHGGTLFLDEIGDMPLEFQAVLLRTLEDKQVMRVGGRRHKKVDFRLITATNKDIYKMGKENQFREDLYFRLSVLTVTIPPLRERSNDAEIISKFLIENYCQKMGLKIPQISPATQTIINEYRWPGNVRQLKNAMIYAINTAQGGLIKPENLPSHVILDFCPKKNNEISNSNGQMSKMLSLETLEKSAIESALLYVDNSVPAAAEVLGISRSTLYRKLKDYNIQY